jgi:hypothetical protein
MCSRKALEIAFELAAAAASGRVIEEGAQNDAGDANAHRTEFGEADGARGIAESHPACQQSESERGPQKDGDKGDGDIPHRRRRMVA